MQLDSHLNRFYEACSILGSTHIASKNFKEDLKKAESFIEAFRKENIRHPEVFLRIILTYLKNHLDSNSNEFIEINKIPLFNGNETSNSKAIDAQAAVIASQSLAWISRRNPVDEKFTSTAASILKSTFEFLAHVRRRFEAGQALFSASQSNAFPLETISTQLRLALCGQLILQLIIEATHGHHLPDCFRALIHRLEALGLKPHLILNIVGDIPEVFFSTELLQTIPKLINRPKQLVFQEVYLAFQSCLPDLIRFIASPLMQRCTSSPDLGSLPSHQWPDPPSTICDSATASVLSFTKAWLQMVNEDTLFSVFSESSFHPKVVKPTKPANKSFSASVSALLLSQMIETWIQSPIIDFVCHIYKSILRDLPAHAMIGQPRVASYEAFWSSNQEAIEDCVDILQHLFQAIYGLFQRPTEDHPSLEEVKRTCLKTTDKHLKNILEILSWTEASLFVGDDWVPAETTDSAKASSPPLSAGSLLLQWKHAHGSLDEFECLLSIHECYLRSISNTLLSTFRLLSISKQTPRQGNVYTDASFALFNETISALIAKVELDVLFSSSLTSFTLLQPELDARRMLHLLQEEGAIDDYQEMVTSHQRYLRNVLQSSASIWTELAIELRFTQSGAEMGALQFDQFRNYMERLLERALICLILSTKYPETTDRSSFSSLKDLYEDQQATNEHRNFVRDTLREIIPQDKPSSHLHAWLLSRCNVSLKAYTDSMRSLSLCQETIRGSDPHTGFDQRAVDWMRRISVGWSEAEAYLHALSSISKSLLAQVISETSPSSQFSVAELCLHATEELLNLLCQREVLSCRPLARISVVLLSELAPQYVHLRLVGLINENAMPLYNQLEQSLSGLLSLILAGLCYSLLHVEETFYPLTLHDIVMGTQEPSRPLFFRVVTKIFITWPSDQAIYPLLFAIGSHISFRTKQDHIGAVSLSKFLASLQVSFTSLASHQSLAATIFLKSFSGRSPTSPPWLAEQFFGRLNAWFADQAQIGHLEHTLWSLFEEMSASFTTTTPGAQSSIEALFCFYLTITPSLFLPSQITDGPNRPEPSQSLWGKDCMTRKSSHIVFHSICLWLELIDLNTAIIESGTRPMEFPLSPFPWILSLLCAIYIIIHRNHTTTQDPDLSKEDMMNFVGQVLHQLPYRSSLFEQTFPAIREMDAVRRISSQIVSMSWILARQFPSTHVLQMLAEALNLAGFSLCQLPWTSSSMVDAKSSRLLLVSFGLSPLLLHALELFGNGFSSDKSLALKMRLPDEAQLALASALSASVDLLSLYNIHGLNSYQQYPPTSSPSIESTEYFNGLSHALQENLEPYLATLRESLLPRYIRLLDCLLHGSDKKPFYLKSASSFIRTIHSYRLLLPVDLFAHLFQLVSMHGVAMAEHEIDQLMSQSGHHPQSPYLCKEEDISMNIFKSSPLEVTRAAYRTQFISVVSLSWLLEFWEACLASTELVGSSIKPNISPNNEISSSSIAPTALTQMYPLSSVSSSSLSSILQVIRSCFDLTHRLQVAFDKPIWRAMTQILALCLGPIQEATPGSMDPKSGLFTPSGSKEVHCTAKPLGNIELVSYYIQDHLDLQIAGCILIGLMGNSLYPNALREDMISCLQKFFVVLGSDYATQALLHAFFGTHWDRLTQLIHPPGFLSPESGRTTFIAQLNGFSLSNDWKRFKNIAKTLSKG